jgi:hypothetical protein
MCDTNPGPQDGDDLRRALDLLEKHFDELALDAPSALMRAE